MNELYASKKGAFSSTRMIPSIFMSLITILIFMNTKVPVIDHQTLNHLTFVFYIPQHIRQNETEKQSNE